MTLTFTHSGEGHVYCHGEAPALRVLNLGAGVQSTTLALRAACGEIQPGPDFAIFADTKWESEATYRHLSDLIDILPFPIHVVSAGDIRTKRGAGRMPWFVDNDGERGILLRACTDRFKVRPMDKFIKKLIDPKTQKVERWIGISTDEASRMKPSPEPWAVHRWPLIEDRMSRGDCIEWIKANGMPAPPQSSCLGCPFHNDAIWLGMKRNDPEGFESACAFEDEWGPRVAKHRAYLHASLKPLREVEFKHEHQINLFEMECEGMCGV